MLDSKIVQLLGDSYLVYLKDVPSRILPGGTPQQMTRRAFVKRCE